MLFDYKTRTIKNGERDSIVLKFLYNTIIGRLILKLLTRKFITNTYAKYMNSRLSKPKIKKFIKKNNINMEEYIPTEYKSFNEFFMRKIKKDARKIEDGFISVSDSKVSVYKISDDLSLNIKRSKYSINELIGEDASKYNFKYAIVFRLCVDDYHHYIFPDDGKIISSKYIAGKLHTVRPIALKKAKVFTENARCVTHLMCKKLGRVAYIEVGALMVGKIVNEEIKEFKKGEEKGHFEFGGSTIILLLEDKVKIDEILFENTNDDIETIVKMGNNLEG